jgi:acetylornithine/N-succinyldiaminopimelate aminotransferase
MTDAVADCIKPGNHGTTFGGNVVACRAGEVVMNRLLQPAFMSVRTFDVAVHLCLSDLMRHFVLF